MPHFYSMTICFCHVKLNKIQSLNHKMCHRFVKKYPTSPSVDAIYASNPQYLIKTQEKVWFLFFLFSGEKKVKKKHIDIS